MGRCLDGIGWKGSLNSICIRLFLLYLTFGLGSHGVQCFWLFSWMAFSQYIQNINVLFEIHPDDFNFNVVSSRD